jgi:hypothetical protein
LNSLSARNYEQVDSYVGLSRGALRLLYLSCMDQRGCIFVLALGQSDETCIVLSDTYERIVVCYFILVGVLDLVP